MGMVDVFDLQTGGGGIKLTEGATVELSDAQYEVRKGFQDKLQVKLVVQAKYLDGADKGTTKEIELACGAASDFEISKDKQTLNSEKKISDNSGLGTFMDSFKAAGGSAENCADVTKIGGIFNGLTFVVKAVLKELDETDPVSKKKKTYQALGIESVSKWSNGKGGGKSGGKKKSAVSHDDDDAPKTDKKKPAEDAGEDINAIARKAIKAMMADVDDDGVKITKTRNMLKTALTEADQADKFDAVYDLLNDEKWTDKHLERIGLVLTDAGILKADKS